MARKVTVRVVDDVDSESEADQTVEFSLDGTGYEIDLTSHNAARLRDDLAVWVAHARRTPGRGTTAPTSKPAPTAARARTVIDRNQAAAIRDWARRHGHPVSARGRIAAGIVELYNSAHTS
ncbi:Lsr2 family protein [Rhodococcus olei]|uniref:Lsr2 family protein n=1 Tax=Rhodococcus olei TaxID=2161675 RepID=A0ABP8NZ32_9NOCA